MGQAQSIASGFSRFGQDLDKCGVPLGMDWRLYALTMVHGVPRRQFYLNMYPEFRYSHKQACDDVQRWRSGDPPKHTPPLFHKIIGPNQDPRMYVLKKVYRLVDTDIADVMRSGHFTRDMALDELAEYLTKRQHRYRVERSIVFHNLKGHGVFKPGSRGVDHGYSYDFFKNVQRRSGGKPQGSGYTPVLGQPVAKPQTPGVRMTRKQRKALRRQQSSVMVDGIAVPQRYSPGFSPGHTPSAPFK